MKGGEYVKRFEDVYTENNGFIFRFLIKLCGDVSLAEELTQETFYRAYMNFASLKNEQSASAWLCTIAKNTYYAWFNEQKKKAVMPQGYEDDTPDIAELFEEKELADRAFAVLHSLDEPYKEVFMLYAFGGLSLKAISSLFEKSESWARVTYYRAKQKIMEGLANDEL